MSYKNSFHFTSEIKAKFNKNHLKLEFMFMKHYAPNRCEPSIEALNFRGRGDQGRCERRGEVFVKIHFFFFGGGVVGSGVVVDVNREVKFL